MAEDVKNQLITRLRQSQFFTLQLDESTDIGNEANLMCFVRYSIFMLAVCRMNLFFVVPCRPTPQGKPFLTRSTISLCRIISTGHDVLVFAQMVRLQ